jgi:hypothetical protein
MFVVMFTKSLRIGFIGLVLFTASAWAGNSVLQGIVKDPKGHPLQGADVRIEAKDGSKLFQTVKTDASGRYISDGLPAGIYRVTLVVNGAVKASINNTKTKPSGTTQLNFELRPTSPSQVFASGSKGKHMVWMPSNTGTHLGGRWIEVDDTGTGRHRADKIDQLDESKVNELQLQNGNGQFAEGALKGSRQ